MAHDARTQPVAEGESVSCPRCNHQGPLTARTHRDRNRTATTAAMAAEGAGLLLLVTGPTELGVAIMLLAGVVMLANTQTPTGACASCRANLAQDWQGAWFVRP